MKDIFQRIYQMGRISRSGRMADSKLSSYQYKGMNQQTLLEQWELRSAGIASEQKQFISEHCHLTSMLGSLEFFLKNFLLNIVCST